jgi:uncharacterized protein YndB with AHSA1/START domain
MEDLAVTTAPTTNNASQQPLGDLSDDATLTLQRRLPGPIERVWTYLTDSDLRQRWLAAGAMEARAGGALTLVWRNHDLSDPPGERPEGFSEEHRMESRVTAFEPPHRLSFTWQDTGEVTFELRADGDAVLLTLTHRRITRRTAQVMIGAGWHAHLDVLIARLRGDTPAPFWDNWKRLKPVYEQRVGG